MLYCRNIKTGVAIGVIGVISMALRLENLETPVLKESFSFFINRIAVKKHPYP